MNPLFHGKTLNIKINHFFIHIQGGEYQNTPFSWKMRILDFLKKYPFIHEGDHAQVVKFSTLFEECFLKAYLVLYVSY